MSLFIVGSASRTTCNIIHQALRSKLYSSITVADLLPQYHFHNRFYRLQRELDNLQPGQSSKVTLTKISVLEDLQRSSNYDDVLYVTHDYYTSVTAKTKLMELLAQATKTRARVYYATPLEYDHFGYANPVDNYLKAEKTVLEINPNSTIIRSDIQDSTETLAFYNKPHYKRGFLENQVFSHKFHFEPRVVSSLQYARLVCETIAAKAQGKRLLLQGKEAKDAAYANFNENIEPLEYEHARENVVELAQKYNAIHLEGYERVLQ